MKKLSSFILLGFSTLICFAQSVSANTIVIDAGSGINAAKAGAAASPFKTLAYAWPYIHSGDTVYLKGGKNGTVNSYTLPTPPIGYFAQGPSNMYTSWTYFIGDSANTVTISNALQLGANGGQYYAGYNAYMSWENVTFADGITSFGANYFTLTNCRITRQGPLRGIIPTGGIYNDKVALYPKGGNYWTVTGCEITQTGFGFYWGASNSSIIKTVIHDVTQDGGDFIGCTNVLFQGNTIFNCAEGDFSSEIPNPGTTTWARHCDGLQFIMQNDRVSSENSFVTIRGNKIYGVERADIQDNNNNPSSSFHNHDILIENNIFGPTVGGTPVLDFNPIDNLVVRQNTICMGATSTGVPYSNQFETMQGTNGMLLTGAGMNVQIYNNLLGEGIVQGYARCDHNIYQFPSGVTEDTAPLARGCMRAPCQLANPGKWDGILIPGSVAVNAGSRLTLTQNQIDSVDSGIFATDFYGTTRDNLPDCGAYELPNQHPAAAQIVQLVTPINPSIFMDNFADGDLLVDPLLGTATTSGLGWTNPASNNGNNFNVGNYNDGAGNQLTEATNVGTAICLMNNVPSVTDFVLSFNVIATSGADGGGPCFLQTDALDFYWLRLGATSAAVHQIKAGVDKQILLLPGFALGRNTRHAFTLAVMAAANGAVISVSRDNAVTQSVAVPSSMLPNANQLSSIGLYRNSAVQYQRLTYNNFRLQIGLPSPPTNLRVNPTTASTKSVRDGSKIHKVASN